MWSLFALSIQYTEYAPGVYLTLADLIPAPHQEDFGAYYLAARALSNGESPFDAQVAARLAAGEGITHHSPYIYPPLLALVLRPLAVLPYAVAAAVWFVLSAGALLAALWLLRPVVQLPWRVYGWMCAFSRRCTTRCSTGKSITFCCF